MKTLGSNYQFARAEKWRLWLHRERWDARLWPEILRHLEEQAPARHPRTSRLQDPTRGSGEGLYLKIYYRWDSFGSVKDLLRDSKALRALKQGLALRERGFQTPLVVAAGEERQLGLLQRAFLLSVPVAGLPLNQFLSARLARRLSGEALRRKRRHIDRLAREIRRMHALGFVHGDLVPSNIFLRGDDEEVEFCYMDNDRTRRYPPWLAQRLWKRNLIQLNRFVLAGISLQDRLRFLRAYLAHAQLRAARQRRLLRWLERKTRQRRRECERIDSRVSFRELMRWNGPFTQDIK